jgi:signal peptidase I
MPVANPELGHHTLPLKLIQDVWEMQVMRAYDGIKAERGHEVNLETPDFLQQARRLLVQSIPIEIRMSGGTMSPAIEDGDVITIEPIPDNRVAPGDVILYQSRYDTAVIHRVVRVERGSAERTVLTRGDAATQTDVPVPLEKVLGRVKLVERGGESVKMVQPRRKLLVRLRAWFDRIRFRSER